MCRRRGDNPFAVISPEREPVTGALFKKQIHRADLTVRNVMWVGIYINTC